IGHETKVLAIMANQCDRSRFHRAEYIGFSLSRMQRCLPWLQMGVPDVSDNCNIRVYEPHMAKTGGIDCTYSHFEDCELRIWLRAGQNHQHSSSRVVIFVSRMDFHDAAEDFTEDVQCGSFSGTTSYGHDRTFKTCAVGGAKFN